MSAKLLICIVRRGRGDYVVSIAKNAGSRGGTILFGRGTARGGILRMLGLADTEKEVVFILGRPDVLTAIATVLKNTPDLCRKVPGIGFVLEVSSFLRGVFPREAGENEISEQKQEISMESAHRLVCVIVNAGFADDIMFAAREAGATGGTILRARGTATGKDASFFGVPIVPEKELLMILVKKEAYDTILAAVCSCPCLSEPAVGIVFSMPVQEFFPLGKSKN